MFTCLACEVVFVDPALQAAHYRTEWHIYNLKRKVAELPALTAEAFDARFPKQENKESVKQKTYCEACKKTFSNAKSFANHANSKKHQEMVKADQEMDKSEKDIKTQEKKPKEEIDDEGESDGDDDDDDDIEIEEVDSDEWDDEPFSTSSCLFCSNKEKSFEKNMKHMTLAHSFFIPDIIYCNDIEGLVEYLGEKVERRLHCLWCNGRFKKFKNLEATKCHMRDLGHCKLKFEGVTLLEFSEFYDYSSSYPDADNPNVKPDDDVDIERLCSDGYELTLPSGAVIGHRSLLRYYKQRLNPERRIVPLKGQSTSIRSVMMKHYRALGWKETSKSEVAKKARDVTFMRQVQSRHWMKLGVKANKFQTHFRPQVMF